MTKRKKKKEKIKKDRTLLVFLCNPVQEVEFGLPDVWQILNGCELHS